MSEPVTLDALRLDKWLVYARFCKTRTVAAELITGKRLRVNSTVIVKPHHKLRLGDVLTFPQGNAIRVVRVLGFADRRGPAKEARSLYADLNQETGPAIAPEIGLAR